MSPDDFGEVISSMVRMKVMDAVSVRPRTLAELSDLTGISVQGVLRHLKKLAELGLVEERKVTPIAPKARRVYSAKGATFGDYSTPGLTVVKPTERVPGGHGKKPVSDLERASSDLLVQRRRIRAEAARLGKMIDDMVDDQESLRATVDGLSLTGEQRLILEVLLTEETMAEGLRVLSRYYGLEDRRSIDEALAQAKRIVGK